MLTKTYDDPGYADIEAFALPGHRNGIFRLTGKL